MENKTSRRKFLHKLWAGLGVIATIEFAGLFFSFLFNRNYEKEKAEGFRIIGRVEDIPPGSVFPYRSGRFYLCRLNDGGFIALSLRCTHLGCSVSWNADKNEFICPCHSSAFDIRGNVINPPASRALDMHPVIIENGLVKVDNGTRIERKRFDDGQLTYAI